MNGAFLILADNTAAWRIAGLPQLDRLVLALNEATETSGGNDIVDAAIFWHPDVPSSDRWLPRHPRITRIRLTEAMKSVPEGARVLDTRLFVQRHGLTDFLGSTQPVRIDVAPDPTADRWSELRQRFNTSVSASTAERRSWSVLDKPAQFEQCERQLLSDSSKSQDGMISRFLNRPLSRRLSRVLLRYEISPTAWTMYAFGLPLLAFVFLARGDYFGIVAGAILFHLYSIVDGCDGEIARATYQESERGGRLDDFLDMIGSMLYVVGLGFGLFRSRSSFYLLEGIVCAGVIVTNEWSLRRVAISDRAASEKLNQALYPRHQRLMSQRGLGGLNENLLWWILQFTKRDAAIFGFLILAVADQSPWILHLWLIVSAATLIISARSSSGNRDKI